jgi:salicylate 5-hydroxylase large subunit
MEIDLCGLAVYNRITLWRVSVPCVVLKIRSGAGGQPMVVRHQWPKEGVSRIPYWVYTDPEVYAREQERIFCGRSWAYVALEAEIPTAGDFKRTYIGDKPVVVVRDKVGGLNVVENRCAHRGVQFCQTHLGHATEFMCPYHQWTYNLQGALIGLPFRRGIKQQGGMPADFALQHHGLRRLQVATRHGVVFATFADEVEPLEDYLGLDMLKLFDRVFDGRKLEVLGYSRQLIPANWKLMFENIKDPYHASLLHVFLVTFGLFRADNPSKVQVDKTGRHGALISWRGEQQRTADNAEMKSLLEHFTLQDPTMLQPVREFPEYTVVMTTLWPNLIIQQQSNTLAMRQLITKGPEAFELAWTFFGYQDEPDDLRQRRIRQANLMGPAGFVSLDDSEVIKFAQDGLRQDPEGHGVMEMGGRDWQESESHMVTEGAIRAFYDYYRRVMEL